MAQTWAFASMIFRPVIFLKASKNQNSLSDNQTTIASMKYLSQVIISLYLIILISGCNKEHKEDKCISFSKAPVTKIEGAGSALANHEVILKVSFGCYNGCGQFGDFDEIKMGNTTTIIVNAKYQGCFCTQDAPVRQTLFKFKESETGTYDLKFWKTENTYLTHTIIVQ